MSKNKRVVSAFIFIIVASCFFGIWAETTILAQNSDNNYPMKRGEIVADFLSVAFTDKVWNEGDRGFSKRLNYIPPPANIEELEKLYPWFINYMTHPNGWPDSGVIYKWSDEITIGIGLPFVETGASETISDPKKLIREQVLKIIPLLESATNRSIKFIAPSSESYKKPDEIARIRIVPLERLITHGNSFDGGFFREEPKFWGGVLFEGSNLSHMRGYLLPEHNNELGFAFCKINVSLDPEVFANLVTECVIRSMGLPGISKNKGSFLSRKMLSETFDDFKYSTLEAAGIDMSSLRLLYCPALKSGMSKNDVIKTVSAQGHCLDDH